MKNLSLAALFFCLSLALAFFALLFKKPEKVKEKSLLEAVPTIPAAPSPTPMKKVLSFEETNRLFGPCAKVFVLMYHHIQPAPEATEKGQNNLSVTPENLRKHLDYLQAKGYSVIAVAALADFFEKGITLPQKSVILTFDDGYRDFYSYALPLLKEFAFPATVFLPTGLVGNADYLTWQMISEVKANNVYFANHTWSHRSLGESVAVLEKEIKTADSQLAEKGLNTTKVFAYPYGKVTGKAKEVLAENGYKLAFTVNSGTFACAKKNLEIPRLRVGNNGLANYGL